MQLAPGIEGIAWDSDDEYVMAFAHAVEPGEGAWSAWLDSLPTDKTLRALAVPADHFTVEALMRRGFVREGLDLVRHAE